MKFESVTLYTLFYNGFISLLYTRVLTRVKLTSGPEPSSNPPMDVAIRVTVWVVGVRTGGEPWVRTLT